MSREGFARLKESAVRQKESAPASVGCRDYRIRWGGWRTNRMWKWRVYAITALLREGVVGPGGL